MFRQVDRIQSFFQSLAFALSSNHVCDGVLISVVISAFLVKLLSHIKRVIISSRGACNLKPLSYLIGCNISWPSYRDFPHKMQYSSETKQRSICGEDDIFVMIFLPAHYMHFR